MESTILVALILGIAFILVSIFVFPRLKSKGINVDSLIQNADSILEIVKALSTKFNFGSHQKIVDDIVKYAELGVKFAEQSYKSGVLIKSERKKAAIEYVVDAMRQNGVELTEDQKLFLDSTIEAMVFLLPKTEKTVMTFATSNVVNTSKIEEHIKKSADKAIKDLR